MTIAGCRQFSLITPPTASVNKSIVVDTTNRRWTSVCNKFVRTDYLLKLSNQDRLKSDLIQVVRSFYWRLNKRRPVQSAAINFSRLLLGFVSVIAFVCVFFIRWLIRSLDVITGGKKSDCATRRGPPFFFSPDEIRPNHAGTTGDASEARRHLTPEIRNRVTGGMQFSAKLWVLGSREGFSCWLWQILFLESTCLVLAS